MIRIIRTWLIHRLGITECGAFGGIIVGPSSERSVQRWCLKSYGHTDSCAYDLRPDHPSSQPGAWLRNQFKGWGKYE